MFPDQEVPFAIPLLAGVTGGPGDRTISFSSKLTNVRDLLVEATMRSHFAHIPVPSSSILSSAPGSTSPSANLPRLYSIRDVCALFNRRPRTIRAWCQAGHLVPHRVGNAVFFTEEAIKNALGATAEIRFLSVS